MIGFAAFDTTLLTLESTEPTLFNTEPAPENNIVTFMIDLERFFTMTSNIELMLSAITLPQSISWNH